MKNLKSAFASVFTMFLMLALATTATAQNTAVKLNMSAAASSMVYTSVTANATSTSILLMDTKTKFNTAPASMMFPEEKPETILKPVKISLSKLKRVSLGMKEIKGCKPSATSTNKPFRFSTLTLTVRF